VPGRPVPGIIIAGPEATVPVAMQPDVCQNISGIMVPAGSFKE